MPDETFGGRLFPDAPKCHRPKHGVVLTDKHDPASKKMFLVQCEELMGARCSTTALAAVERLLAFAMLCGFDRSSVGAGMFELRPLNRTLDAEKLNYFTTSAPLMALHPGVVVSIYMLMRGCEVPHW